MEYVLLIFSGIAALFALYTWGTIWSRRETRVRGLAVLGFVMLLGALGPASLETLGWHRPHWAAVRLDGDVVVLSFKLVRGEAIYLYVDAGPGQPRAIYLPWSDEEAQKFQEKQKESEREGRKGRFKLRFSFNPWYPKLPMFIDPPKARAIPPKPPTPPAPQFFRDGR